MMAKIGYARVSTKGQNDDSQVDELTAYGCDKIFTDHGVSGKHASRPQLDAALEYMRPGDTFVITRLSRSMRSLHDLLDIVNGTREDRGGERKGGFKDRGIDLVVLKQGIDTSTPAGRLMFHFLAAIDEFQRELIIEGTREGLEAARSRGRVGGAKAKLSPAQAAEVRKMYGEGRRPREIMELFGISRATLYRYVGTEAEQAAGITR
jgi:DNA invertase Pin-like site-specific DNA recombinase